MAEPISVVAQILGGAGAVALTGTALTLSAAELLVTLVEEGLLGLPGPTIFRTDLIVLKESTVRRLRAKTTIDEAHALQEIAIARQEQAEARRRIAEAVAAENRRTLSELTAGEDSIQALPGDIAEELREALRVAKRAGASITIDSPEIRQAQKSRRGRKATKSKVDAPEAARPK